MGENIMSDDLRHAFDNDEEAEAAFTMFDKDLNGDISKEELEAVCAEIGRERKAITASLKDLASVVRKLDDILLVVVLVITLIIFINLISTSAQAVLTSLGSAVLALSWLLSATAQEFLQSLIFVFVKHPFDVGDRVTIYGNTGVLGRGDDYFVKEISLLYTEFKKMEGHVVQAPNSYLNTLFILNQRRSGGLAEAVPIVLKFGTTMDQLQELRERLVAFVKEEKREYQSNILTELTTVTEVYSITLNIVFFYKSNWQNELLRLQRRNKFICFMMVAIQELGIEGPRRRMPGGSEENPMYLYGAYPNALGVNNGGVADQSSGPRSGSMGREQPILPPLDEEGRSEFEPPSNSQNTVRYRTGTSASRNRSESISEMRRRVDFSLGAKSSGTEYGELFEDRKPRLPFPSSEQSARGSRDLRSRERESEADSLSRIESRDSTRLKSSTSLRTPLNRLFGSRANRNRGLGSAEEGTDLQDLEAGSREIGPGNMPDIPEASGGNSATTPTDMWGEQAGGRERRQTEGQSGGRGRGVDARIDARSGMTSGQARDNEFERGELPRGVRRAETEWTRR
jgi:small-conductance mechanosensitive channel